VSAPVRYRLYGLTLASPFVLPCRRARGRARPDVTLVEGSAAQFTRARSAAGRLPRDWFHQRQLPDGAIYVRWRGAFEFLVSSDGRVIHYRPLAHATLESLTVYLLGQMLSFSLLARGSDPLHGTCVAVNGGAVAFVGECGYGKSTLGAAMLSRGCPVVADDLVSLGRRHGSWLVHPGIPRLKLAPRLLRHLLGRGVPSEPMIHGTTKRVVPLSGAQSVARAVPLAAIYVLAPPRARGRVVVDTLAPRDGFLEIVRAAFNLVVHDRRRYANQFAFAAQLAADVPVRRLAYPRAIAKLPAVCDAVLADVRALPSRR
jgi:hypothetical protein